MPGTETGTQPDLLPSVILGVVTLFALLAASLWCSRPPGSGPHEDRLPIDTLLEKLEEQDVEDPGPPGRDDE